MHSLFYNQRHSGGDRGEETEGETLEERRDIGETERETEGNRQRLRDRVEEAMGRNIGGETKRNRKRRTDTG
jgi:hypothetical protein